MVTPRGEGVQWSSMDLEMAPRRTTNTMKQGLITSTIIHSTKPSPQKGGISARSIDLTCSICQQKGDQRGPPTEK